MNETQVAALKRIGNEWQGASGNRRIYINDLYKWYGLEVLFYNSGAVMSAKLDGRTVSNSSAKAILGRLNTLKIYYDFEDGQLHSNVQYSRATDGDVALIVENIMDAIEEGA